MGIKYIKYGDNVGILIEGSKYLLNNGKVVDTKRKGINYRELDEDLAKRYNEEGLNDTLVNKYKEMIKVTNEFNNSIKLIKDITVVKKLGLKEYSKTKSKQKSGKLIVTEKITDNYITVNMRKVFLVNVKGKKYEEFIKIEEDLPISIVDAEEVANLYNGITGGNFQDYVNNIIGDKIENNGIDVVSDISLGGYGKNLVEFNYTVNISSLLGNEDIIFEIGKGIIDYLTKIE